MSMAPLIFTSVSRFSPSRARCMTMSMSMSICMLSVFSIFWAARTMRVSKLPQAARPNTMVRVRNRAASFFQFFLFSQREVLHKDL